MFIDVGYGKSDSQSTDSSAMEVEEGNSEAETGGGGHAETKGSQIDVDSGIENMEVEETKESTPRVSKIFCIRFLILIFKTVSE